MASRNRTLLSMLSLVGILAISSAVKMPGRFYQFVRFRFCLGRGGCVHTCNVCVDSLHSEFMMAEVEEEEVLT